MSKNQANQRSLWMIIGFLSLGYGVGGGISNYSDHGMTIPVMMQIVGGLIGMVFAYTQAKKK